MLHSIKLSDMQYLSIPTIVNFGAPNALRLQMKKEFLDSNSEWKKSLISKENVMNSEFFVYMMADSKISLKHWMTALKGNML